MQTSGLQAHSQPHLSSHTHQKAEILSGWLNGFVGMVIFSGSLPATRVAVLEMNPVLVTLLRASIAGLVAASLLLVFREKRPAQKQLLPLASVTLGCVVGFPLLTALALQHINAAQSTVFLGLLPLSTAIFGVLRGGERPQPAFWVFAVLGSVLVMGFALRHSSAVSLTGDALMLGAVVVCGWGYAEGATLTRTLGGWQVISWALLLALPVMLVLLAVTVWAQPGVFAHVSVSGWVAVGYIALFSMLIGFVFWYKGLALGGIAAVGQLQLLQPFFGLALCATLLHEPVSWLMLATTLGVILCVLGSRKFAHAPLSPCKGTA